MTQPLTLGWLTKACRQMSQQSRDGMVEPTQLEARVRKGRYRHLAEEHVFADGPSHRVGRKRVIVLRCVVEPSVLDLGDFT